MKTPGEKTKKSGGSFIVTAAVLLVLSALAGGGGWLVGMIAGAKNKEMASAALEKAAREKMGSEEDADADDSVTAAVIADHQILTLAPITTNLSFPSNSWVRVEVALVFDREPDPTLAELIHQDVMAYMRTVSLPQIEGPRGFQHLRDDLSERAVIRSNGRVSKLLFRTFLIE
ncbi:flagellar basal body-associated FliL family protein [Nitratireductor sp. XY-223]|uniref:flagellar basal body-associated FliL family protein n=1 Tax=Nitratireductor sp. XY-223 TaxID=2561926 RepID=UPI0010A9D18F|nr:flagellar basal body-associated FliL family protein [Nitratireductor sp. XY-223]